MRFTLLNEERGYVDILFLVVAVAIAVLISGATLTGENNIPNTSYSAVSLPPSAEHRSLQLNTFGITSPTPFTDPNALPSGTSPAGPASTSTPQPSGPPAPTSTPTPTLPPTTTVNMTFYTAQFPGLSHPCIHSQGGGTGTFTDPISFASPGGAGDYPWCAVIYVPRVQKYFIHENSCGTCTKPGWVDLYIGSQSGISAGQTCANQLTDPSMQGRIVVNPPAGLPYDPTPIFTQPNTCMASHGF